MVQLRKIISQAVARRFTASEPESQRAEGGTSALTGRLGANLPPLTDARGLVRRCDRNVRARLQRCARNLSVEIRRVHSLPHDRMFRCFRSAGSREIRARETDRARGQKRRPVLE